MDTSAQEVTSRYMLVWESVDADFWMRWNLRGTFHSGLYSGPNDWSGTYEVINSPKQMRLWQPHT